MNPSIPDPIQQFINQSCNQILHIYVLWFNYDCSIPSPLRQYKNPWIDGCIDRYIATRKPRRSLLTGFASSAEKKGRPPAVPSDCLPFVFPFSSWYSERCAVSRYFWRIRFQTADEYARSKSPGGSIFKGVWRTQARNGSSLLASIHSYLSFSMIMTSFKE